MSHPSAILRVVLAAAHGGELAAGQSGEATGERGSQRLKALG